MRKKDFFSRWFRRVEQPSLDYPKGASKEEQMACLMRQYLVHRGCRPVHSFVLYAENASRGIVLHQGVGTVGRDDTPIDEAYQYNVASITKPIVATIVLQLVEEGRLRLEDRAGDVLAGIEYLRFPELHIVDGVSYADEITVDQLLQHRTGLGDVFIDTPARFNLSVLLHPRRQYSPQGIMETFFAHGLNEAPTSGLARAYQTNPLVDLRLAR